MCMYYILAVAQQQTFKVAPADVSEIQGGTAIIKCVVDHKQGQLQWTKTGTALGRS